MDTQGFDFRDARRQCMGWGLRAAVWWSASFIATVLAFRYPVLGNVGLLIGLLSVWRVGYIIKRYNWECGNTGWMRTWWMSFLTYIFCALATTLVQYLWFRFLDNGMLAHEMELMLQVPAYKELLERMNSTDTDSIRAALGNLSWLTYSFLTVNISLALVLSLPTMVFARMGLGKRR
ncbi:MAG: DUF4199 domain-containing protein [Prevotellaceae bacterium]|nr:DUF4199 domain-containing protein [Prevotellaceae bacterium]